MKPIKGKFKNTSGFSFAEMLFALLIVLMVSTIVAAGIPSAQEAYFKVLRSANAQVLLSTVATELRDEFTLANNIAISGNVVTFESDGIEKREIKNDPNLGIVIKKVNEVISLDNGNKQSYYRPLVSEAAANRDLCVFFQSVEPPSGGVLVFTNIGVFAKGVQPDSTYSNAIVKMPSMKISLRLQS